MSEGPILNELVPDFVLPDQDGVSRSLSEFIGEWVLLFFYLKDDTPIWNAENKAFGKSLHKYNKLKARPIGISVDSVEKHKKFLEKHKLDLTLLADPGKSVVRKFSGTNLLGWAHRKSFLIDPFGKLRKIYNVGDFKAEKAKAHAEEVVGDLEVLMELVKNLGFLELKNQEMIDSISSASRIQKAVLPDLSKTMDEFCDFDFIWEPRDIVGGDCYWSVKIEKNVWFGLFDCTGHGVPGAFVSLILLSKLMRIFQETLNESEKSPARLLSSLDVGLRESLSQEESVGLRDDGADGAIIHFEIGSSHITFAGANMPVTIQQGGDINDVKGVKQSLGYRKSKKLAEFINNKIEINDQTRLYIFTDGILDEGRETDGIAFGRKRLMSFLSKSKKIPLSKLCDDLKNELNNWRNNRARRDDMTFFSIKPL